MAKSSPVRDVAPDTVWLARGRYLGPDAEDTVRRRLRELKSEAVIQDLFESDGSRDSGDSETPGDPGDSGASGDSGHSGEASTEDGRSFEARWKVADDVVVRARLDLRAAPGQNGAQDWLLVAEADRSWELDWPSPATVFWPEDADSPWDHDVVSGLRFRQINPLPSDDRALKRLLKECTRHTWSIHVVIHEAMTTGERGLRPLAPLLPPSLRHRIVEHRAAPEQFQVVNWALYDLGVRVPRGGAVVLPSVPGGPGVDDNGLSVRSVFLDGSAPTDLIDVVRRRAEAPGPLPEGAEEALTALREQWHLTTLEEELVIARRQVAAYAEALEAMTKSRDLYREAAELAHEALAGYQESFGALPSPRQEPSRKREGFSFRGLAKRLGDGGEKRLG